MRLRTYARSHRFGCSLALTAFAGCVLRVIYDVASRHEVVGGDGFRYHYGSLFLADGKGFVAPLILILQHVSVPDTGHPPAWTILLAGVSKLGLRTWLEHQITASVVGTATIVMTGLAAAAAVGKRVGLLAAVLAAGYPFVWVYEREALSEPLALLGIATIIWLAYRFIAKPRACTAVALGAVVGVLAMTKSDQIAVAFLLVAPLILSRRRVEFRTRLEWLAAAAAICIAIMAPWSIYLSSRFDRPVVVAGAFGGTLAAGNCTLTYHGSLLGYYASTCVFRSTDSKDPLSNDANAQKRALTFMRAHESQVPVVAAARIGRTFALFRPFQQIHLETERGTSAWVFRVGFFAYWVLLPFALAGVVMARRHEIPVYPLLVFPVVVATTVLLTIGSVRYRAPAEIPLAILAAIGIDGALRAVGKRLDGSGKPVSTRT